MQAFQRGERKREREEGEGKAYIEFRFIDTFFIYLLYYIYICQFKFFILIAECLLF